MGIRDWFRDGRPADEREVREEIAFHLDRATQQNLTKGMSPEQARAEALRGFGDLEQVRRGCLTARGRGVHPIVAWTAVAALGAVSFASGYLARTGPGGQRTVPVFSVARGTFRPALPPTTSIRRSVPVLGTVWVSGTDATGRVCTFRNDPRSPFATWYWRDGTAEVTLDGKTWYELVSAAGVPAATLRDEYCKSRKTSEGINWNSDPYTVILGNERCRGTTVEIVLRNLADSTETRVACVVPVQVVPPTTPGPR